MKRRRFLYLAALSPFGAALAAEDRTQLRQQLKINPYDKQRLDAFAASVPSESNANIQSYDLTICYLTYCGTGEMEKGKAAYTALMQHHPGSTWVERIAPERFKKRCPDCQQRRQRREICPDCNGSNICPTCKGTGKLPGLNDKKVCPTCNGNRRCPTCRNGYIESQTPCKTCRSSGWVLDQRKMMQTSKRLLEVDLKKVEKGDHIRIFRTREERRNREERDTELVP